MRLFCAPGMVEKYDIECNTRYERVDPLRVQNVPHGIVFPLELSETNVHEQNQYGGVCTEDLKFVELSLTRRVSPPNFTSNFVDWYRGANPAYSKENFDYIDETVVFIGALSKHFGHYILEGLSRLWFLLDRENLENFRYVCISDDGVDRFEEFLRLFGLPAERVTRITRPTKFKAVIVPEQSIRLHDYYSKEYKATIDKIMSNIEPIANEKVYFSKRERKNDRAIGERPIELLLAKNGYAIYYPENMSVGETLSVLKGCKHFLATSGTNIHNSIFLRNEVTIVCLNRSAHFHPIQIMIDRMRELNSIYVDSYIFGVKTNWSSGPFLLFPTRYLLEFIKGENFAFEYYGLYAHYPLFFYRYAVRAFRRIIVDRLKPLYAVMKSSEIHSIRWLAQAIYRLLAR